MEVGGGVEIIYLLLHCHSHMTPALRWAATRAHFNVSLIVSDKVTRQCPQTTTFLKSKESRTGIEPRPFHLQA